MTLRLHMSGPMPDTAKTNCKVCGRSNDVDDMLSCITCRDWYHVGCASVDRNAAKVDEWICGVCEKLPLTIVTTSQALPTTSAAVVVSGLLPGGSDVQNADFVHKQLDQAQMDLLLLRDQQELMFRELEMQQEQELERKKLELEKLMLKAKMNIMSGSDSARLTDTQQSSGVGRAESMMKQMEVDFRNLMVAQPPVVTQVTSSTMPTFCSSSTPTTTAVPRFDSSLPAVSQDVIPPYNPPPPVTYYTSADIERYRQMGAVPKHHGSTLSSLAGWHGLTFTQLGAIPATSISAASYPTSVPGPAYPLPYALPTSSGQYPPVPTGPNPAFVGQQVPPVSGVPGYVGQPVPSVSAVPGYVGQPIPVPAVSGYVGQPIPPPGVSGYVGQPIPPVPGVSGYGGQPIPPVPAVSGVGQPIPPVPGVPGYLGGPSSQQLLARQVIPRELPTFDGNPDDWPIFYSSYVNSSTACGFSDVENLARLQRSLKGRAFEAVKSRLLLPACVPHVINTLYQLFGRPELIIHTLLNKVREIPAPRAERLETLISFGTAVQNLCGHLEAAGQIAHLCNPVLLQELVEKVPAHLRLDWALYKRQFVAADLRTFAGFMSTLVMAASDVTVSVELRPQKAAKFGKATNFLNTHSAEEAPATKRLAVVSRTKDEAAQAVICLVCNQPKHKVKECPVFKKMSQEDRWKEVQEHHLCRTCLGKHGRRTCRSQTQCNVDGCQKQHHPFLHNEGSKQVAKSEIAATTSSGGSSERVNAHHQARQGVLFRMLPVQLQWEGKTVDTYAFLDDGSSLTLIDQAIAAQLGVSDGETQPLCLSWTSNVTRYEPKSQRIRLQICGSGMKNRFWLNDTRTVASLNLPEQTLDSEKLGERYRHLRGLPVQSYDSVSPGILIGSNNASLIASLKIHEGQLGDPIATKTRLGWAICGSTAGDRNPDFALHVCECVHDQELHDQVKQHFAVESVGVSVETLPEAEEVKRARAMLERTTKRVSQGFETGLLWRYDSVTFPDSLPMAKKRWSCFERRMQTDPELGDSVRRQISEYLESGYIHRATPEELTTSGQSKVWYLPLGAVRHPKKPDKIRLVWDAAAKAGGVSLNAMLLKGPDFLTALPAVLCGFRERKYAICGDIKQMYHRFRIRSEDVQCQRFLYRPDPASPVQVYIMDVGTFGATCSPSQAQYIKNKNAQEHEAAFPKATIPIVRKHYVDDYMDSYDDEAEAVEVALQVIEVHRRGGFNMHNWLSNSPAILRRVGAADKDCVKSINLDKESTTERVLGMLWQPREDVFSYAVPADFGQAAVTKRNILRNVMSFFDPLGLLSNFLVHGRLIMQEIWRTQIGWDDDVPEFIENRWRKWIELVADLDKIRIPRPYFPGFTSAEIGSLQLHIFNDASEDAFASAAYFRAEINGRIYCTLVMAKAKVAPLKALSVPRLELQGALIGARLAKTVRESHTLPISQQFLWTDSETVLAWIKSDHRRYRQFVAFRVGEILSKTEPVEWRWVPSKQNVADEATKWGKGPCVDENSRWFRGPDFLYLPESEWPTRKTEKPIETEEELRPSLIHREVVPEEIIAFNRFSKWERLLRAVAYVRRFLANFRRRFLKEPLVLGSLSQQELQSAENKIWCVVQRAAFPDEVAILQSGTANARKQIEKTSKVYKLSPFLDDGGVMRMDSRISAAPFAEYDFKYPVIVPRHHYATALMVDWYHRKYLHANQETIVNEVRQRFHVPRLRVAVREIAKSCQYCKILKAKPEVPRMAPLPEPRIQPWVRPFTFVGLDYFGPIYARMNRSVVKRWVALFTCLTVRAIHLEVVYTLSTESCKKAVRRFVSRRGSPSEIYTDNGTNFQGASRELREEIADINTQLGDTFTNTNTRWVFNPPSAPNFGGVWERLVRSVKLALGVMANSRTPDDETLWTIIIEAESIVNSRPLTFLPLETADQEAITPNHFILLSSSGVVQPPKTLGDQDAVTRNDWDLARQQVDRFWTRWVREYLPTLAKRTKWFKETNPLKPGDLVVVVEDGVRNGWTRGQVASVVEGRDGRVRQAIVQTSKGFLRRPVSKLAVLAVNPSGKAGQSDLRYGSGGVTNTTNTDRSAPQPTADSALAMSTSSFSDEPTDDSENRHQGSSAKISERTRSKTIK